MVSSLKQSEITVTKTLVLAERVLKVACYNFYTHGFRRVTMSDIARELGISKKTLYTVIPDKQTLVALCVEAVTDRIAPQVARIVANPGRSADRFLAITRIVAELPRLVSPLMLSDLQKDYPELWSEVEAHRRLMLQGLEDALTEGQSEGEVRQEIDPKAFVRMVTAVIDKTLSPEAMARGEYTIDDAISTMMIWISSGIFQSEGDLVVTSGAAIPKKD